MPIESLKRSSGGRLIIGGDHFEDARQRGFVLPIFGRRSVCTIPVKFRRLYGPNTGPTAVALMRCLDTAVPKGLTLTVSGNVESR